MKAPKPDKEAWNAAGFEFRKPLCAMGLAPPESVRLRGQNLVFDYFGDPAKHGAHVPTAKMLREFMRLGRPRVRATRYLEFARAWGPLGICEHGVPGHHARLVESAKHCFLRWCVPYSSRGLRTTEPIVSWRRVAGTFVALLNVAAAVAKGKRGDARDWQVLYEDVGAESKLAPSTIQGGRHEIERILNKWMVRGDVRLRLTWLREDDPSIAIGGNGPAYGALVALLALVVSRAQGLLLCSNCRVPFVAVRRPPRGEQTYCRDCVPKSHGRSPTPVSRARAWASDQQSSRDDRRKARRLWASGRTIEWVCAQFPNRNPETIRKWLSTGTRSG